VTKVNIQLLVGLLVGFHLFEQLSVCMIQSYLFERFDRMTILFYFIFYIMLYIILLFPFHFSQMRIDFFLKKFPW
jgi:hypothetical protein